MPRRREDLARWSWLVAITGCFLAVGIIGLQGDLGPSAMLRSFVAPQSLLDSASDSAVMADLVSSDAPEETTTDTVLEVVQEIPPPVELVSEAPEIPDLVEALAVEDLFMLSTAPKIEEALRPIDPTPPKPVVQRTTPTPSKRTSTPSKSTSKSTGSSSGSGTGTGAGGNGGGSGTGGGAFVIPRPTYPSSLRSLGVQGTVRLRITVGTSGRATSVTVIGTSGNSTLDQYAAGWVRRNGKAPPGAVRTVIAPLSFVLR